MNNFFRTLIPLIGLAALASGFGPKWSLADVGNTVVGTETHGSADYKATVERFLKREQPKIVGGKLAPDHAYPWQVSLGVSWIADPSAAHFCGGSVYSATWIVTAAHCVVSNVPEDIIVTAGTNRLTDPGVRRNLKRIVVKSDYNDSSNDNDIALLELFDPLPLSATITPILVVASQEAGTLLKDDTMVTVTGWGYTQEDGNVVHDLRYVTVPIVNQDMCNGPLSYNGAVSANMLCAGAVAGGQDSCQGDSGGPLIVSSGAATKLAGIVSWGEGCARPRKVGIYTRVSNYSDWIVGCVAKPDTCH